jgi:hypothetical protein
LTFFVEIDVSKTKVMAKAMLPFVNCFYCLEDNKKKVVRYFEKVQEHQDDAKENPNEEPYIIKHFYNNRKTLIKQHMKEEKEDFGDKGQLLKKNFFRYTMPFCHFTGFNLWLLKPTKLNRGRGIHVINNLTQLKALI